MICFSTIPIEKTYFERFDFEMMQLVLSQLDI